MSESRRRDADLPPTVDSRGRGFDQTGNGACSAEGVDHFVCESLHAKQYAIIGSLSQAQTFDNRHCDSRKTVRYEGVDDYSDLRPEAANIFRRLEALNLSQRALADAIGIEENKVSKVKSGTRQFQSPEVLKAHEWLDDQESSQPRRAQKLSPDAQSTRDASEGETTAIIALDLSASMGPGTPIEDFVEEHPVEFDIGLLRSITRTPYHRLRVIRGVGNSMEPKFYTGDRILVDTTERALSRIDGYYWITLWGAHGLKRLRPAARNQVEVISENREFDPIVVDAAELTIEGRAIWFARDL